MAQMFMRSLLKLQVSLLLGAATSVYVDTAIIIIIQMNRLELLLLNTIPQGSSPAGLVFFYSDE
jgi:hypothetical protein